MRRLLILIFLIFLAAGLEAAKPEKREVKPKAVEVSEIKISTAVFAQQAEEMRTRLEGMKAKLRKQSEESKQRIDLLAQQAKSRISGIKQETAISKGQVKEKILEKKEVSKEEGLSLFMKIKNWIKGLLRFIGRIFSKIFGG